MDSIYYWEYCSPEFGVTVNRLRCKAEHPCFKHGGTNYYWCHVEQPNPYGWTWDYCSPPFDSSDALLDENLVGLTSTSRNFEFSSDDTCPSPRSRRGWGDPFLKHPFNIFPPNRYVYRLLANGPGYEKQHPIDEGNGLGGLQSRSLYYNETKPVLKLRTQVFHHVRFDHKTTPWISTSNSLDKQLNLIEMHLMKRIKTSPRTIEYLFFGSN